MIRAALLLSLLLGGCGVGGILAASSGGGGGGGGGSARPSPPVVTVFAPQVDPASNFVSLSFQLRDPRVRRSDAREGGESDPRVRIVPQFRFANGSLWRDMTEAPVAISSGTRALPLGQALFVWNALLDTGGFVGRVRVRFLAEYEPTAGLTRRFRVRDVEFDIDNRRAGTVLGGDVIPGSDVETFPIDIQPSGPDLLVASLGAGIVERIGATGGLSRVVGVGIPGDTGDGGNPGVARLLNLRSLAVDAAGHVYTNHDTSLRVTNTATAVPLAFGGVSVAPQTIDRGLVGLADSRGLRFHPTGALLFIDRVSSILAFNPQDPGDLGSTDLTVAGVVIAPGDVELIAGLGVTDADGEQALDTELVLATSLAVGPDGEIYYGETEDDRSRVRVINAGPAPLVLPGGVVAPGAVMTVAGTGAGFSGDGGPAVAARLRGHGSLAVSPARALFIADTQNFRVRLVNLGGVDVTFAETTVAPGDIDTVVGTGRDAGGGGVGSRARDIELGLPNAITLDAAGNLLIADQFDVVLVNGGTSSLTAYGRTAGPARTARIYDATRRGGLPLVGPAALHAPSPNEVFFTDDSTVRVLNLSDEPRVFGGASADPGASAVVAGGAVPGFSGDGGAGRSAAFDHPAAVASDGAQQIYVADTENDRVRFIHVGSVPAQTETAFGVTLSLGQVETIVGGAAGPLLDDGDGLAPTAAVLSRPQGVASLQGLLFVADTGHHRIRCVNPGPGDVTVAGVLVGASSITTIVGTGAPGLSPDGAGPWMVDTPTALAADGRGLLYFAEPGSARIRVLQTGLVEAGVVRVAGLDVPAGEIATLVGDSVPAAVVRGNSGDGGLGPDAVIDRPGSLEVFSDLNGTPLALLFADGPQHVVRLLNLRDEDLPAVADVDGRVTLTAPGGGIVSIAGGPNTFGFPNAPAFDGDDELPTDMRFDTPAGLAVVGRLTTAPGVVLASHVFVSDQGNDRLRRFGAPPIDLDEN